MLGGILTAETNVQPPFSQRPYHFAENLLQTIAPAANTAPRLQCVCDKLHSFNQQNVCNNSTEVVVRNAEKRVPGNIRRRGADCRPTKREGNKLCFWSGAFGVNIRDQRPSAIPLCFCFLEGPRSRRLDVCDRPQEREISETCSRQLCRGTHFGAFQKCGAKLFSHETAPGVLHPNGVLSSVCCVRPTERYRLQVEDIAT